MQRYLSVNVLTTAGFPDCTNNGISANGSKLFVPCDRGNWTEEDIQGMENAVILEVGKAGGRIHFREKGQKAWTMFGGNFAYSSDSRFTEMYPNPIHIHDRIEN